MLDVRETARLSRARPSTALYRMQFWPGDLVVFGDAALLTAPRNVVGARWIAGRETERLYMSDKNTIAVIGATGAQGGGLVRGSAVGSRQEHRRPAAVTPAERRDCRCAPRRRCARTTVQL